ncbi:pimeloyl-ACP methyl ester carboxylesterase [Hymenobacter luteus]|uniref:Pimeloyl-ACP methyl ester carboxylesterase n=2 Tax=Hymenobacter TaxID=89966 RepID=A0A7W9WAE9_9BACT|nr:MULTISPECIES: alpha/beta hydrolase [Hymenobacter]MBB4600414.1 pimeloyl-ACP methyl ester carboxylesterase [Hymenobacter latericoloratus]MBB6057276.1 pimeloyl-ACP methyl ester carboxylesterase [Hymenobacter luteus]
MSYIKVGQDANGSDVKLHYIDQGTGNPIVLIHGWPATYEMWEYQLAELPKHGNRVVAYTRRGFGNSSKTWEGNDYDTFADDLNAVLETLNLQNVTLVGFSMGGGEVARYMSRYGGARVARVAFVSAVTPFLLKTDDNPDGADKSVFDDMVENIRKDRFDFLQSFGKKFFGVGVISHPVSQATLDWMQSMCQLASPRATEQCVYAFAATDFRQDLAALKVPTLVIHGSSDDTVPAKNSGERMTQYVPHAQFVEYSGAPHGLFITEKDRLNRDLLAFASGGNIGGTANEF